MDRYIYRVGGGGADPSGRRGQAGGDGGTTRGTRRRDRTMGQGKELGMGLLEDL